MVQQVTDFLFCELLHVPSLIGLPTCHVLVRNRVSGTAIVRSKAVEDPENATKLTHLYCAHNE